MEPGIQEDEGAMSTSLSVNTEALPVTSSLFRLSWISDDSDSDESTSKESSIEQNDSVVGAAAAAVVAVAEDSVEPQMFNTVRWTGIKQTEENSSKNEETGHPSATTSTTTAETTATTTASTSTTQQQSRMVVGVSPTPDKPKRYVPGIGRWAARKKHQQQQMGEFSYQSSHVKNAGVIDNGPDKSSRENVENNPFEMLEKMAAIILTTDETQSVKHYVHEYFEKNDVELLVSQLLGILNNPEKHLLLTQIREVVSPFDRGRYDSMLSYHEDINIWKKDPKEMFSEWNSRMRRGLKVDQSLLQKVQLRRKQLDVQMQMIEHLKKSRPKPYKPREEDLSLITVYVSKNIRTLGISITGGADCRKQYAVMIDEVHPGGAAAETKRILPGMVLISVDEEDVQSVSHKAAVFLIRKAFTDHKKPYLKLVLRKPTLSSSDDAHDNAHDAI